MWQFFYIKVKELSAHLRVFDKTVDEGTVVDGGVIAEGRLDGNTIASEDDATNHTVVTDQLLEGVLHIRHLDENFCEED